MSRAMRTRSSGVAQDVPVGPALGRRVELGVPRRARSAIHCFVGVTPSGQVVSQFAGIPRRVQVGAEERVFAEMVDSFVDPEFRKGSGNPASSAAPSTPTSPTSAGPTARR